MEQHGMLGIYNLMDEIQRFVPEEGESGRRAETLVKTDHLRVVLVTMRGNSTLNEHGAPGPITIQALEGQFVITVGAEDIKIVRGGFVAIAAGVRHAVTAVEDGAFLLTIGYAGNAHQDSQST